MNRFSERRGYGSTSEAEITMREEAPFELRGVAVDLAYECGLDPHKTRRVVCRTLRVRENPQNWSAFPNVDQEVRDHLDDCEWFFVYDVIEAFHQEIAALQQSGHDADAERFEAEINRYFRREGIGWQLSDGQIQVRGSEEFEAVVRDAKAVLEVARRPTAASEIHQALLDLSRRPEPDVSGAIQHALASLECVARDFTGDDKATLGTLLKRHADIVPKPLDSALHMLWGYASEQGRHLKEGRAPGYAEAELAVVTAAAVARYLSHKDPGQR